MTSSVTAIWPPTGLALAALLLGGYRLWPAVALGALLTNLDTGAPAGAVLGITTGNTLEALAGAFLLRRVGDFRPSLERVRDVLSLVFFGALLSTLISATIGVTSLLLADEVAFADSASVWRTWWLGDIGGDMIVAPAILIAVTHRPYRKAPGTVLEAIALAIALGGVSVFLFLGTDAQLVYPLFPLLIWAALRFWQPGAAVASLAVAVVAVVFTANGEGPFAAAGDPDEELLLAQTFVSIAGLTALVLAAVTSQRWLAEATTREIAATLQESLLPPPLPQLPGIESATHFAPAGEGYRVGGDFYDFVELGDGSWALMLGDVCGKGVRAAALTGLARHALRIAATPDQQPSEVLRGLNAALLEEHEGDELCTATYARFTPRGARATVALASGGHPLPLLLSADGTVAELGEGGTLLGVMPDPPLHDHRAELRAGETIVFYTDGLLDAYAPGRAGSLPDLPAVLHEHVGESPAEIVAAIRSALLSAPGLEPRDDVAIVVLRVAGG